MTNANFKQKLAENFDVRSLDYNRDNFHGRLVERVIGLACPRAGESVLDVATGTGLAAVAAALLVGEGGRVVGIDLSPGMLVLAARSVESGKLRNVELLRADAETFELPAGSVDVVLCVSALPYLTDIPAALRRWYGFLRPGGRVAFNCWSAASYITGFLVRTVAGRHGIPMPVTGEEVGSPDLCRTVLSEAGFVEARVEVEPSGGHYVPMEKVERAWEGWVQNPVFHPHNTDDASRLLGLREEYMAEARARATEQGVWDEMTAYFVVGRKR